jgi:peptidoglycan/xylan/chitin deacetylase (PgdA/CDA1 family)
MRSVPIFAGATGAIAWTAPALAPIVPAVADALRVDRTVQSDRSVAVTFDDGPHLEATSRVLDALRAAGARATFFLVGEQVLRRPALAAEIAAAGHEIALHGHRHRNALRLTPRMFVDDFERGRAVVSEATGIDPARYRPPYGIFSAASLVAARARLQPLLWSRWARDWRADATAESVHALVTRDLTAGDVLLLHDADEYSDPDCWRATVAALPRILETIAATGLRAESAAQA